MNSVKKYWLDGIFDDDDNDNDISMEMSREKDISYNFSLKEIEEKVVVSKDNLYNSSPKKEIELKVVVSNETTKDISMKNSREKDISNETTKDAPACGAISHWRGPVAWFRFVRPLGDGFCGTLRELRASVYR